MEQELIRIKVKYNQKSTKVEGYFPNNIKYKNNIINEELKTIDGSPYIEITEEEHQAAMGKTMCVIDGVFQEYVQTDAEILEQTKNSKIAQCKSYLAKTDWQAVRLSETGEPMKDGVAEKRAIARSAQDLIEACTTLDELNQINTDF